MEPTLPEFKS